MDDVIHAIGGFVFSKRGASLKSDQDKQSTSYYDQKAQDFFDTTFDVLVDSLYQLFFARLELGYFQG